jgi:hypothetical protein
MQLSGSTVLFTMKDTSSWGNASISGDRLTLSFNTGPLRGNSFTYRIDSEDQFTGNGETYRR